MYIVTGGAGFIGANIVKGLNERGVRDVLVVDDFEKADKFKNLVDCEIGDYLDKRDFYRLVTAKRSPQAQGGFSTKAPAPTRWSTTART